jgi:alanyl-tRNA synthetase
MGNHTELLYLSDSYLFDTDTLIIENGVDDQGSYVALQATVFYPGGGGQEPDKGVLITPDDKVHPIVHAAWINGEMRHYVDTEMPSDGSVKVQIDREHRLQNEKLHTGGHLLASTVYEKLGWPLLPVKGFHYQQGAYVEFEQATEGPDPDMRLLDQALVEGIHQKLPVTCFTVTPEDPRYHQAFKPEGFIAPEDRPLRLVQIGSYLAYPCGGTHLHDTGEFNWLRIRHLKHKKGRVRISYEAG